MTPTPRPARLAAAASLGLLVASAALARDVTPFAARAGLETARAGAIAWAPDAHLVYLENDEAVDEHGATPRWGYLFYSPGQDKLRAYSIRDGKIVAAEFVEMQLEAPPLEAHWIDSGEALAAAERGAGARFRHEHRGRLKTMLLMRGAFDEQHPDATTWTFVYASPEGPSLFVVVDAQDGAVRRTWRG